jgi:hypothetical protein
MSCPRASNVSVITAYSPPPPAGPTSFRQETHHRPQTTYGTRGREKDAMTSVTISSVSSPAGARRRHQTAAATSRLDAGGASPITSEPSARRRQSLRIGGTRLRFIPPRPSSQPRRPPQPPLRKSEIPMDRNRPWPAGSFPGSFRRPAPHTVPHLSMGRHLKPFTIPDIA